MTIPAHILEAASAYDLPASRLDTGVDLGGGQYQFECFGSILTLTDSPPAVAASWRSKYQDTLAYLDTTLGIAADAAILTDLAELALLHGSVSTTEMQRRLVRGALDVLIEDGVING